MCTTLLPPIMHAYAHGHQKRALSSGEPTVPAGPPTSAGHPGRRVRGICRGRAVITAHCGPNSVFVNSAKIGTYLTASFGFCCGLNPGFLEVGSI